MRISMYNNIANAYRNLFCGGTVIAALKCLITFGTLKQTPGGVLQYLFMI